MPVDNLALLKRAKEYMEILADGTDPVSGQRLSRADPMGSERMSRCFAFVAATLTEVIAERESGKTTPPRTPPGEKEQKKKRGEKAVFLIDPERLETVPVTETPANMAEMASRLNDAAGLERSDLSSTLLSGGLEAMGFLEYRESAAGKRSRVPTEAGYGIGIVRKRFVNAMGQPYQVNLLTAEAQRFLLENLEAVLEAGRRAKGEQAVARAVQKAERMAEKARVALEQARAAEKN